MTKRRIASSPRKFWTDAEKAILRERYPHEPTHVVAAAIGRSVQRTLAQAAALGLKKSAEYLASPHACRLRRGDNVGAAFRFKPGQAPPNKGLRRPGYSDGRGRMQETQFKKGQSRNAMPIGAERLIDGYRYVKVAAVPHMPYTVNWLPVHILEWERANGRPLPPGHCLWFRDGDRMNVAVDNLELITRREAMRRNTIHNLPPALKETVQLLGRVNRQIRKRTNHATEKQDRRSA